MTYNINDKVVLKKESIEKINKLVNSKFFTCLAGLTGEIIEAEKEDEDDEMWYLVSFKFIDMIGNNAWWFPEKDLVKKED